jgi:hypothetical protein
VDSSAVVGSLLQTLAASQHAAAAAWAVVHSLQSRRTTSCSLLLLLAVRLRECWLHCLHCCWVLPLLSMLLVPLLLLWLLQHTRLHTAHQVKHLDTARPSRPPAAPDMRHGQQQRPWLLLLLQGNRPLQAVECKQG